ncbi:MAG: acyl carrier protein, partial [Butyrivibrio sp.]|nr:acyl carrier protein [Butyrivibrio sp.]
NLITLIEDKYKIEIEEESYRSLNTVQELIEYLEGRINR